MKKCFAVHSTALGDTICSTPTLRKLSHVYKEKLDVATFFPQVFKNSPYVKKTLDLKNTHLSSRHCELFETFVDVGKKGKRGVEKKHNVIDIRQFHATDLGFSLLPAEMECNFYPDPYEDLDLPLEYVCLHPTQTWESRTWPRERWQELTDQLVKRGVSVVLVGKDSQESGFWDIEKPTFKIEGGGKVVDLLNKTGLSQTWHVIAKASKFITMDSGLLHLAGTTDTPIIQLGSSINYKLRAPYRKGSQEYKYDYVGGSCDIFCASDLKYSIKEWGTIQGVPPLIKCLEDKPTYECHPSVDQVMPLVGVDAPKKGAAAVPQTVLIHLNSASLGDNLAWIPQVEQYRSIGNKKVSVQMSPHLVPLFVSEYPLLDFIPPDKTGHNSAFSHDDAVVIGCDGCEDPLKPVIRLATDQLGLPHQEIRPKIAMPAVLKNNFDKKYVCIGTQSTAQFKYWNNPTGWKQVVDYLKSLRYEVVCIDQYGVFGTEGNWNHTPENAIRKNEFKDDPEIPLSDRINDLHFCEFFIGLSSGLAWLAWALEKPVIIIAGGSALDQEFYTPYKITNTDVCHACFSDISCMPFDRADWLFCPRLKDTSRQFECTTQITFEMVKEQIDRLL